MEFKFRIFFPWESDFSEKDLLFPEQDVWRPPANIFEDEEYFFIEMELPGLEKDQVEISVEGSELQVKGERRVEKRVGRVEVIRREIPYGFFLRTFRLPSGIDSSRIEAVLEKGILLIKLPKRKRIVEVEDG